MPQREARSAVFGKRVYCQGCGRLPFWEAASLEWSRRWDLSRVRQVVINGNGAAWIDEAAAWFAGAVRQRDGFHLARWCARAVGWEAGRLVYQWIRAGQAATGADWRRQVDAVPPGARGLGTMESQQDKLIANRMKKRGMSWTIRGAQRGGPAMVCRAGRPAAHAADARCAAARSPWPERGWGVAAGRDPRVHRAPCLPPLGAGAPSVGPRAVPTKLKQIR